MLTPEERKLAGDATRVMQIIVFALIAGAGSFLVAAHFNRSLEKPVNFLAMAGVLMAVATSAAALILPSFMESQGHKTLAKDTGMGGADSAYDAKKLLEGYQVRKIVKAALFEGAAFLNIVVYQLGGPPYSLAIVVALLLALAMQFPLRPLVEERLDRELRIVREQRSLNR